MSLTNHTMVLYDMSKILTNLEIEQSVFTQICILSGTDYSSDSSHSLYQSYQYFQEYRLHL